MMPEYHGPFRITCSDCEYFELHHTDEGQITFECPRHPEKKLGSTTGIPPREPLSDEHLKLLKQALSELGDRLAHVTRNNDNSATCYAAARAVEHLQQRAESAERHMGELLHTACNQAKRIKTLEAEPLGCNERRSNV